MSALLAEMWAWYALTVIVVLARMTSRRLLYGSFKRMLSDDYLMVFAMLCYTGMLIVVHILTYTPTNLISPGQSTDFTPSELELRQHGSRLVLVVEETQMFTIWAIKGCFLFMYNRLTTSKAQKWGVKILTGYCIISFIVMQILFLGAWCRPFYNYWAVPPPDLNCSAETNHMITNAVFNISTDVIIILFPMPMFVKSQLALKRKLVLCGVFALGAFTILAAALSKYYSLGQPYGGDWIYWYIREVSTAIITANLPMTWTLLQRCFRIGSFHGIYAKSSGPRTGTTGAMGTGRFRSAYGNLGSRVRGDERTMKKSTVHDLDDISPSESQEGINWDGRGAVPLQIFQTKDVQIISEEIRKPDPVALGDHAHNHGLAVSHDSPTTPKSPTSFGHATSDSIYGSGARFTRSDSTDGSIEEDKPNGEGMGTVTRAYHGV